MLHDRRNNRDYEVGARYVVVAADSLRSPQLLSASGIRPTALGHYLNKHTMTTSTIQLDRRCAINSRLVPEPSW